MKSNIGETRSNIFNVSIIEREIDIDSYFGIEKLKYEFEHKFKLVRDTLRILEYADSVGLLDLEEDIVHNYPRELITYSRDQLDQLGEIMFVILNKLNPENNDNKNI